MADIKQLNPGHELNYALNENGRYCLHVNVSDHNSAYIEVTINKEIIVDDSYFYFSHCFDINTNQVGTIKIINTYLLTDIELDVSLIYTDIDLRDTLLHIIAIVIISIICCFICCLFGCFYLCCRRNRNKFNIKHIIKSEMPIEEFDIELEEV